MAEVVAEQARDGAAEAVDRLVRVADDDESRACLGRRDDPQQLELRGVDVLELVDEDEPELVAHPLAEHRVGLEQFDRPRDQVAEVEEVGCLHPLLVRLVRAREHTQTLAGARLCREQQGGRMDEVLLHQRNKAEQVLRERLRVAHPIERPEQCRVELTENFAHDDHLLETVEEEAFAVRRVVAQQARAEAVEGRDPRLAVVVVQPIVDAPGDLTGRAGREGEDEDLVTAGDTVADRLLIQVDQRMRLPRARSGQHTKWSRYCVDVERQRGLPVAAGDLIMRALVSWGQPRLLTAARPRSTGRGVGPAPTTATA